jgi:hypothetical protein
MDERLVAIKETMPAGQQIAFEPALTGMFGQNLHNATVRRQVVVVRQCLGIPGAIRCLEHMRQAIGRGLVRAEYAEVPACFARAQHVP